MGFSGFYRVIRQCLIGYASGSTPTSGVSHARARARCRKRQLCPDPAKAGPRRRPPSPITTTEDSSTMSTPDPKTIENFLRLQYQLWSEGKFEEMLGERSEEHTSELQSRENLVCRLLLEKKKKHTNRD